MDPEDITIEIRSGLGKIGQVDMNDVTDLKLNKRFNNVGSWSLSLPSESKAAQDLAQPGRGIIVTGPYGELLTGSVVNFTKEQDTDDPVGITTITGADDNVHLGDALAWPDPTNDDITTQRYSNDIRTNTAERVIRDYVALNIGDPYADGPDHPHPSWGDTSRKIPGLTLELVNANQGAVVTGNARFDQLGKLIGDVAAAGGVGFDIVQVSSTRKELKIYTPTDKSKYIRMDVDNDLLDKTSYGFGAPSGTRVIEAGQGDGVDRQLLLITSDEAAAAEAAWGRKVEIFKDRRDTNDIAELTQDGQQIIAENGKTITSLSVTPSDNVTMVYGKDWFLGDIVGVDVDNVPLSAVVTEATISITTDGLVVAATIGDPTGFDYDSRIIAAQQNQETRIAFLEKNAEVGQTLQTGIVDPLWTSGMPQVTFDGASGPVQITGWTTEGGYQPKPGEHVLVARVGEDWFISGPVSTSLAYLNNLYPVLNAGLKPSNNTGGTYYPVSYTKTSDGIVMMQGACFNNSGAVWTAGQVFFTLPVGFRPDYDLVFPMAYYGGHLSSLTVAANGDVFPNQPFNTTDSQYWGFGNVAFPAAGVASWINYDDVGSGMALANGFTAKTSVVLGSRTINLGKPRIWKDTNGFAWVQGALNTGTVLADGTPMLTLPAAFRGSNMNHVIATANMSQMALIGCTEQAGAATGTPSLSWKTGQATTPGWVSLSSITGYELQSNLHAWQSFPGAGGWAAYGSGFTAPGYLVMPNKMVRLRGLFSGPAGTTIIGTLPVGARGTQDAVHTAGSPSLRAASNNTAMIENNPNGGIWETALASSNAWFSFDIQQFALGG